MQATQGPTRRRAVEGRERGREGERERERERERKRERERDGAPHRGLGQQGVEAHVRPAPP